MLQTQEGGKNEGGDPEQISAHIKRMETYSVCPFVFFLLNCGTGKRNTPQKKGSET